MEPPARLCDFSARARYTILARWCIVYMPRRELVIAENHRVIVEGIVKAIQRAHDSLGNANVTVS